MSELYILGYVTCLCLLEAGIHKGFWTHRQWQTDLLHILLTPRIVLILHHYLMAPIGAVLLMALPEYSFTGNLEWIDLLWLWPLADLMGYCMHRLQHSIPFLWRFHRVHHSSNPLNTLAGSRSHPLDLVLQQSAWYMPFFLWAYRDGTLLLGEGSVILTAAAVYTVHIVFTHYSVQVGSSLEWLISTPSFHHRHHGLELRGNYGLQLSIWDGLFGTVIRPQPVTEYGISPELPTDWLVHMLPPNPGQ